MARARTRPRRSFSLIDQREQLVTARVLDRPGIGDRPSGQIGYQARPTALDRAREEPDLPATGLRGQPGVGHQAAFGGAADERRRRPQSGSEHRLPRRRRDRRMLLQDVALGVAQLSSRLDAEVGQRVPCPLEGVEGVVLAAARVERSHEQLPRPLAPGGIVDQTLEPDHRGCGRPSGDLRLGQIFPCRQMQLVEAYTFGGTEVSVAELEIGRAAAQPDRGGERFLRSQVIPGETLTPTRPDQVLEPPRIDRRRVDREPVAARDGLHQRGVGVPQGMSQTRDMRPHRRRRARWRVVAPEGVDDRVERDDVARPARQQRQQPPAVRPRDVQGPTVGLGEQLAEHEEPSGDGRAGSLGATGAFGCTCHATYPILQRLHVGGA